MSPILASKASETASRTAFKTAHACRAAALVLVFSAFSISEAPAIGPRVKLACAGDYFAYCSQHPVGSAALRQCMRDAGPKLSKRCVNALVAEGEVSEEEVARRDASLH